MSEILDRNTIVLSRDPIERDPGGWGIFSTTSGPVPRRVSVGRPSLMRHASDFLAHFSAANYQANGLITTRTIEEITASPLLTSPDSIADLPDIDLRVACPVGGHRPELWCWLHRPAGGELRFAGKDRLFVRSVIGREIAALFNESHIVTEGAIMQSSKLDAIARGEEQLEAWFMPSWRAKEILPDAFPEPKLNLSAPRVERTPEQELEEHYDDKILQRQRKNNSESAARVEASNAVTAQRVAEELAAQAKRKQIERRVRAEMGE